MDSAQRATTFFARWGVSFEELCASFGDEFAPDCVWDQRPLPRIIGPEAAVRALQIARKTLGLTTIDVEIRNLAVQGDIVHTERVDTLRRANGAVIVSGPVAGVLTYHGDKLVHWREYFDAGSFVTGIAWSTISATVTRLGAVVPPFRSST